MSKIEIKTRKDIAAFLPGAIQSALTSYIAFSEEEASAPSYEQEKNAKAKLFKDHHDACKVAVAHIKLLIELAKWADLPDPEIEDNEEYAQLLDAIKKAKIELKE